MNIEIRNYREGDQPFFDAFNRSWIAEMFRVEEVDDRVLKDPESTILKQGGCILMADANGIPAGTVGLRLMKDGNFELTKMAVDKNFRRMGFAELLCKAAIRIAREQHTSVLYLYSNKKNEAAIRLYEKLGFIHTEVEPGVYERANVKMFLNLK